MGGKFFWNVRENVIVILWILKMLLLGNKMRILEGIYIKIIVLFNRNYYIDMYKVKCIGYIMNIFFCEKFIYVVN